MKELGACLLFKGDEWDNNRKILFNADKNLCNFYWIKSSSRQSRFLLDLLIIFFPVKKGMKLA